MMVTQQSGEKEMEEYSKVMESHKEQFWDHYSYWLLMWMVWLEGRLIHKQNCVLDPQLMMKGSTINTITNNLSTSSYFYSTPPKVLQIWNSTQTKQALKDFPFPPQTKVTCVVCACVCLVTYTNKHTVSPNLEILAKLFLSRNLIGIYEFLCLSSSRSWSAYKWPISQYTLYNHLRRTHLQTSQSINQLLLSVQLNVNKKIKDMPGWQILAAMRIPSKWINIFSFILFSQELMGQFHSRL